MTWNIEFLPEADEAIAHGRVAQPSALSRQARALSVRG